MWWYRWWCTTIIIIAVFLASLQEVRCKVHGCGNGNVLHRALLQTQQCVNRHDFEGVLHQDPFETQLIRPEQRQIVRTHRSCVVQAKAVVQ